VFTSPNSVASTATLHRFRDAYLGGFRPDASGFIELLQGMMRR
jgi:hypothetical protein